MDIRKEWLKGYIDLIILSLLKFKDLYGYEMSKKIKGRSQGLFLLKEGTLYPALKRLEHNRYISGYWQDSEGAARRKYYRITQAGLEELEQSKKEWKQLKEILTLLLEEDNLEEDNNEEN